VVAWSEIVGLFSSHSQVQELGFKCSCICRNHRDFLSLPSKVFCRNWVLQTLGLAKFTASLSSCIIFDRKESHFWLRICSVCNGTMKTIYQKEKKTRVSWDKLVIFQDWYCAPWNSTHPNLNLKLPHHGFCTLSLTSQKLRRWALLLGAQLCAKLHIYTLDNCTQPELISFKMRTFNGLLLKSLKNWHLLWMGCTAPIWKSEICV
jgi:hypothetical protein